MVLRSLRLDLTTGQSAQEVAVPSTKCREGNGNASAAKAGALLPEPTSAIDRFTELCWTRVPRSSRKSLHDPESKVSSDASKRVRCVFEVSWWSAYNSRNSIAAPCAWLTQTTIGNPATAMVVRIIRFTTDLRSLLSMVLFKPICAAFG